MIDGLRASLDCHNCGGQALSNSNGRRTACGLATKSIISNRATTKSVQDDANYIRVKLSLPKMLSVANAFKISDHQGNPP